MVRPSQESDIDYLSNNLRRSDIFEVFASHHYTPLMALKKCHESLISLTVERENPMCMFGVNPDSILGNKAIIWCLATDELSTIGKRFIRHSRNFINYFLEFYPYLYNYVKEDNYESISWLKFCGATIEEPEPYGMDNEPFRYFYFTNG